MVYMKTNTQPQPSGANSLIWGIGLLILVSVVTIAIYISTRDADQARPEVHASELVQNVSVIEIVPPVDAAQAADTDGVVSAVIQVIPTTNDTLVIDFETFKLESGPKRQ